jgi:hypothetical protein
VATATRSCDELDLHGKKVPAIARHPRLEPRRRACSSRRARVQGRPRDFSA